MSGLQPSASKAATLCTQIAVPRTQVRPVHAGCTHAPRLQPMHPGCNPMHTGCSPHAPRLQTPCTQAADPMPQTATLMHAGALLRALHEHLRRADKVPSYHSWLPSYHPPEHLRRADKVLRLLIPRAHRSPRTESTPDYVPSGLCTCALLVRVRARLRVRVRPSTLRTCALAQPRQE